MLATIKTAIANLPDVDFEDFYQSYVEHSQDSIIDNDIERSSKLFTGINDLTEVLQGLNTLTEELKRL